MTSPRDLDLTAEVRARVAAEEAGRRFALLAQVSGILDAAALDYEAGLESLARLFVPLLGDFASVSLVDPDGAIRRLADASLNEELGARVTLARRMPVPAGMRDVVRDVLGTNKARLFVDYTAEMVAGLPPDEPYVRAVRDVGVRSAIFAPLRARGRPLGFLTVGLVITPRTYGENDVALLEAVAERAALAIDNAILYQDLRRTEERYRRVFEQAPIGVARVSLEGAFLQVNGKLAEIVGYTQGELLAATFADITHPDDVARDTARRADLAAGTLALYATDKRYLRKDGEITWAHVTVSVARHASGAPEHFILTVEDINARRAAEGREHRARAEAERANALKDEFLAVVSHELRTPLHSMLGWLSLLRRGVLSPERAEHALATIERNARTQARLIEGLLDVSRIASDKLQLDLASVDFARVLAASVEGVRPAAEAKGLRLGLSLDGPSYVVRGDVTRLGQVAANLLSNAVKFTPSGGEVAVRAARIGAYVELSVSDSGQGIGADFLPHVFERFRQSEASRTRAHGGLGLGLAIAKRLVEEHGGTIHAHSAGEGSGATFVVRIPLEEEAGPAGEPLDANATRGSDPRIQVGLAGLRVLVVDDERDAREMLLELFEEYRVVTSHAGSVAEGIAAMDRARPDVIVTDIAMPGEDGFALLRKVRDRTPEQGGTTPIVALTAHAQRGDRARAITAGFDAYLEKPIEVAELLSCVARLARRAAR